MPDLSTRLDTFATVKKAHWYALKRLGLETVRDLLYHFPARYEDYATLAPIAELAAETKASVEGVVADVKSERSWRKKLLITRATIKDETGTLRVIWFNQRFVEGVVKVGERVRLAGKVATDKEGLVMQSPAFERAEREATHTGRLVPVYPETTGLTSKFLRWQIATLFQNLAEIPDPLPAAMLSALHLPDLRTALAYIHFPKTEKQVLLAEKRFAFEEMLLLQLKSLSLKHAAATGRAVPIDSQPASIERFTKTLPFQLTHGQTKAVTEILADLGKPHPMNRLLNGDVGSGKTVVAAIALHATASAGYQAALLAPTEVLAIQHAATLAKLFARERKNIALLTGSRSELNGDSLKRPGLIKAIQAGIPDIVIGTHALLEDKVRFDRLALVVVDEQHRFGVSQRARLQELSFESLDLPAPRPGQFCIYVLKCADDSFYIGQTDDFERRLQAHTEGNGAEWTRNHLPFEPIHWEVFQTREEAVKREHDLKTGFGRRWLKREYAKGSLARQAGGSTEHVPHFLSMTATPIPRTLSLTLFGNLDLSLLDEVPAHKLPIITRVAESDAERNKVYAFIEEEVRKGRQAFVILPLVETSKAMEEVRAATTEHTRLQNEIFPDLAVGLLHGRQKSKEKDALMQRFKERKLDILVSTAVVEVGIDIPNATVMLIEGAERFGLSQLHQFRGRVGRGSEQSYCFLFPSDGKSPESKRLQALEKHASGFDLAEIDLEIRGPGAFLGTRQSGLPDIAMEHLANARLIALAREHAEKIFTADPALHALPLLKKALQKFEERIHLE